MSYILVTGGAGYIGSHIVKYLSEKAYKVIIYDDLSEGHKESLDNHSTFIKGDLKNLELINKIFNKFNINAVIHLASSCLVGESYINPIKYYENNILSTLNLLKTMIKNNVKSIIFSSSAAVYGNPRKNPISEDEITNPINPYGETKLMIENILKWYNKAYNLKYISLRYFNVAGADADGNIGEDHKPETHLVPNLIKVALSQKKGIKIFGEDYPIKDGTCIRDYIHVTDISSAHILALESLNESKSSIYNLGNETGFSVKEVVNAVKNVTKHQIPVEITKRREGDPAILTASSKKILKELKWKAKNSDLNKIIKTAWNWHKTHPNGYED